MDLSQAPTAVDAIDLTGADWRTSTYTGQNQPNCVEIGPTDSVIGIRDTKNRDQGAFAVLPENFQQFVRAVKGDQFAQ